MVAMTKTNKILSYPLPLVIKIKIPTGKLLLFLLVGLFFLISPFVISHDELPGSPFFKISLFYIIGPLFGLISSFLPIYINLSNNYKITIDGIGIHTNMLWSKKSILWSNVLDISTYAISNDDFLGFITKEKIAKFNEGGFGASFNASFGGLYGISIPLNKMGELDKERVIFTIKEAYGKTPNGKGHSKAESKLEPSRNVLGQHHISTDYKSAIIVSFFTATVTGFIYSTSIYILHINILVLPLIGTMAICHYFRKYINVKDYNIFSRIWLAILGIYSVFLSKITLIFAFAKIFPSPVEFISLLYDYFFIYLPANIGSEFIWLLTAITTGFLGFISGPSSKPFQYIKSFFLLKLGQISYEKNDVYYTLYIVPPYKYDDTVDKIQVKITKGCEIEIGKKKPKFFKIPYETIKAANIKWSNDFVGKSTDENFLEIDMGGTGNTVEYVYDTYLVCNKDKAIELIKIEAHE